MFTLHDVDSFLSQRISQDLLENFFRRQWHHGGTHDYPNLQEFQKNMQLYLCLLQVFLQCGNCARMAVKKCDGEKVEILKYLLLHCLRRSRKRNYSTELLETFSIKLALSDMHGLRNDIIKL